MKKFRLSVLIILLGFSVSCSKNSSSNLYQPTSADVTATATLTDLQQGRSLYVNYCGQCHYLYSPDDYSPTAWKSILSSMAPRTGMNSSEVTLVTKYVTRGKQ